MPGCSSDSLGAVVVFVCIVFGSIVVVAICVVRYALVVITPNGALEDSVAGIIHNSQNKDRLFFRIPVCTCIGFYHCFGGIVCRNNGFILRIY